jgi:hypothetical protein
MFLLAAHIRNRCHQLQDRRSPRTGTCLESKETAAEFRKFLDHRGVTLNSPLHALARLQLARAYARRGDSAQSRAAYQAFIELWSEADIDRPILIVARSEYANLNLESGPVARLTV